MFLLRGCYDTKIPVAKTYIDHVGRFGDFFGYANPFQTVPFLVLLYPFSLYLLAHTSKKLFAGKPCHRHDRLWKRLLLDCGDSQYLRGCSVCFGCFFSFAARLLFWLIRNGCRFLCQEDQAFSAFVQSVRIRFVLVFLRIVPRLVFNRFFLVHAFFRLCAASGDDTRRKYFRFLCFVRNFCCVRILFCGARAYAPTG